ncbi:MAG: zinc ribbon domain-containing protein [Candidatus Atribacteria bacterium]|nr:zinc ribbon domain-containing protein [Candidatus Atribacteria bacterium]
MRNFINIFRLQRHLRYLDREMGRVFAELGKQVYGLIQNKDLEREDLREKYQEITSFGEEIDLVLEEIHCESGGKSRKKCISCGKHIDEGARFCSYCGGEQKAKKNGGPE